jgi:hypothetical protein
MHPKPSLPPHYTLQDYAPTAMFGCLTHPPVFVWYLQHNLPVTPLNPRAPTIQVHSHDYQTAASPSQLPSPSETSLSIITPPPVTKNLLKEAKDAGIPAVWLQPGSFDDEGLEYARGNFRAAIGGMEPGSDGLGSNGGEGWCVLVDGEDPGLRVAGREWKAGKL